MGRISRARPELIARLRIGAGAFAVVCLSMVADEVRAGPDAQWDPFALYGGDISFEVRRNGEPIGHHSVEFDRIGDEIQVVSKVELEVDFTLFDYRFDYQSRDIWRDGQLVSLQAVVDDDGDVLNVSAWRSGTELVVDGPAGVIDVASAVFPSNHWNPAALDADMTLNTLTGEIIPSNFLPLGTEIVETASGPRLARKYLLTLHRDVEIWYDSAGRWVRLRFEARDGSSVDYYCLRCGTDQNMESASRQ
jgi:hypothetical protein